MSKKSRQGNNKMLVKYTGMAIELFILFIILFFLGKKLDELTQTPDAYFTVALPVIGFIGYLYRVYRDGNKEIGS